MEEVKISPEILLGIQKLMQVSPHIKISRSVKGGYGWELKFVGDLEEGEKQIRKLDKILRKHYKSEEGDEDEE